MAGREIERDRDEERQRSSHTLRKKRHHRTKKLAKLAALEQAWREEQPLLPHGSGPP